MISNKLVMIAMSWILSWSAFAIDQLSTTYAYITSSKNESSVVLPGKKVIEKDGVKFMVNSELVEETNTSLELSLIHI